MPRTPSLQHYSAVLISVYEQNIFIKDNILEWNVLSFSWNSYSLEAICSLISDKLFQLQTTTFGMSRDYWKSLEQPYEHYCYNSVKPFNVSHNTESKYTLERALIDHSKLQYGRIFPDTTEISGCGHLQRSITPCRIECLFLICINFTRRNSKCMMRQEQTYLCEWVDKTC